jgi:hypothetical protein
MNMNACYKPLTEMKPQSNGATRVKIKTKIKERVTPHPLQ